MRRILVAVVLLFAISSLYGGLNIDIAIFQDDTLDSVILVDTCGAPGDTLLIPVYLRNPVHTLAGIEVYFLNYQGQLYDFGYKLNDTTWFFGDTTGSVCGYFEYFTAWGDTFHNRTWVDVVAIADMPWGDITPPLYPADTFRFFIKLPVVIKDTLYGPYEDIPMPDTLAYIGFLGEQTTASDTTGLILYYMGYRPSFLQIGTGKFIRGDVNVDSTVNVSDVTYFLGHLFPLPSFPCLDAGDCNDDGSLNVSDATYLLGHLFPSPNLPEPNYPNCGYDPTEDNLDCCECSTCWEPYPWVGSYEIIPKNDFKNGFKGESHLLKLLNQFK